MHPKSLFMASLATVGIASAPLTHAAPAGPRATAPTAASIAQRVVHIIAEKLVIPEREVTYEANFKKDLGADSIDLVELIMEFERAFEISIPDEAAEGIQTVGNAVSYLEKNAAK